MPSRAPASWTMGRIEARCAIEMWPRKGAEGAEDAAGMAWAVASRDGCGHATRAVRRGCVPPWFQSGPMLWLKAFHVVFVVTWFAGLFYLPRLFVYHVATADREGLARFAVMERRLFFIMSLGALLAVLFGMAMIAAAPGYLALGWMRATLILVAALVGYHAGGHR